MFDKTLLVTFVDKPGQAELLAKALTESFLGSRFSVEEGCKVYVDLRSLEEYSAHMPFYATFCAGYVKGVQNGG